MAMLELLSYELDLVTLSLVLILTAIYVYNYRRKYSGYPPGPWGFPIFGYLYRFTKKPYEDFVRLSKKYGDVFSISIGSRSVIVLNNYDVIKETFVKEADIYEGKPVDGMAAQLGNYKSIFVTSGTLCKDQRKFILKSLRDFGFGKRGIEEKIQEEAKLMVDELSTLDGKPLQVNDLLLRSVASIISCLLIGKRFEYEDEEVYKSVRFMKEVISNQSHFSAFDAIPVLQSFIPESLSGLKTFRYKLNNLYEFIGKQIEIHRKTFNEHNIRDIVDVYVMKGKQIAERGEQVSRTTNIYSDDFAKANGIMLFAAGVDTMTSTLHWALKVLALHPNVQMKMQKEIDDVVGHERLPSMNDRTKMAFTEATILEIGRFVSVTPLTLYHRVTEDTILKGYRIPKNTFVLANLWSVHYDPGIWEDPFKFNPERFLKDNEKLLDLSEYVIPFSIGKRSCLAESLVKMELFIFLTSLLQSFTVHTANDDTSFETTHEIPIRKLKSCCLSFKMRN